MVRNLIIAFVVYSIILLLVGRNLVFIPQVNFSSPQEKSADLRKNVLEKFLKNEKGSYSIYYKDLKTGQEFGIDENKALTGASLNKLPLVGYLYNLALRGKINLEEKVIIQKEDIQDYGTGSLRYEEPGQSYSLKNLAKLALEQSDNTAAHVLGVRLDLANVQKYINGLKFVSTDMANNKTTAAEMGKMLDLLYKRKISSETLTREFLDFMRDTDQEDRIPRNLPKGVVVYHKTGDSTGMIHDVGIIDDGENPFILAILTSDITDEEEAKVTIGKIAKFIYNQQR
jgi:beta-lactamase class A